MCMFRRLQKQFSISLQTRKTSVSFVSSFK